MRRMFAYGVARGVMERNPAADVPSRYIARARSRSRVLSLVEIGDLLHGLYGGNIGRRLALAFHLLLLTMVRKGELVGAGWSEFDVDAGVWQIPAERMKQGRPHVVYLSRQTWQILGELHVLASGSIYLLPSFRGAALSRRRTRSPRMEPVGYAAWTWVAMLPRWRRCSSASAMWC